MTILAGIIDRENDTSVVEMIELHAHFIPHGFISIKVGEGERVRVRIFDLLETIVKEAQTVPIPASRSKTKQEED